MRFHWLLYHFGSVVHTSCRPFTLQSSSLWERRRASWSTICSCVIYAWNHGCLDFYQMHCCWNSWEEAVIRTGTCHSLFDLRRLLGDSNWYCHRWRVSVWKNLWFWFCWRFLRSGLGIQISPPRSTACWISQHHYFEGSSATGRGVVSASTLQGRQYWLIL